MDSQIWEELKKIDSEADKVLLEVKNKSKLVNEEAKKNAKVLIEKSIKYANEDANELIVKAVNEAKMSRNKKLEANQLVIQKLEKDAQGRIDAAVDLIVNRLLEK